jgi:hypothetical protein
MTSDAVAPIDAVTLHALPNQSKPRTLAIAWIVVTLIADVVIQSGFFAQSDWMLGDLAYHRGVAYTVQGGALQGEGPYRDLISYYGGIYSLLFGFGSMLLSKSFDALVSGVSWVAVLLIPLAALLLSRTIWPRDVVASAIVVTLFVWIAPLSTDWEDLWVESVLPSASSFWPLYPRDAALALMIAALTALPVKSRRVRIAATALVLSLAIALHAQMALLLVWFLLVHAVVQVGRTRGLAPGVDVAVTLGLAAALSFWWWAPRAEAYLTAGGLLIGDYPGRLPFRPGILEAVIALGGTPVLAVAGAAWFLRQRDWGHPVSIMLIWLVAFLPLVAVSRILPSLDVFSERRIWLVASIGFLMLGAYLLVEIARRLHGWALPVMLVAIVVVSIPGTRATLARVQSAVENAWSPGHVGMNTAIEPGLWRGVVAELNEMVRRDGGTTVITYDSYAAWAWSFSGAQVVSLWLPGPFKLGFDPGPLTGASYLDRVGALNRAFDHGLDGLCDIAASSQSDMLLLEARDGRLGLYDRTAASPYRVDPADRDAASIDRVISPGVRYVDLNAQDRLRMAAGGEVTVEWQAGDVEQIGLLVVPRVKGDGQPLMTVAVDGASTPVWQGGAGGARWVYVDTPGVHAEIRITALREMDLLRVTGFAPPAIDLPYGDGPMVLSRSALCGW